MRLTLVSFLAVILIANSLAAQGAPEPVMSVRVLAAAAAVHVENDPNSLVLTTISGGTILEARSKEGAWYSVWLPGDATGFRRLGYVSATDVEPLEGAANTRASAREPVDAVRPKTAVPSLPVRTVKGPVDEGKLFVDRLPSLSVVVVKPFSATDQDIVEGEKKDETRALQAAGPRMLADRLIAKLVELGQFSKVSLFDGNALPQDALVVGGKFTELDPGSRAKRYFVGFGAGKSAVTVEGTVSLTDGTVLATFRQRRIGVMGIAGGDSLGKLTSDAKSIGEDIAKFLSEWARGSLK